jgi:uncharacterized protein YdaU (DUF1376 family)
VSAVDSLPFMSFAVDKWLVDSQVLTPVEYMVVHRLLCLLWRSGKVLSKESAMLAKLACVTLEQLDSVQPAIASFFRVTEDGYISDEVIDERQRALQVRDSRRRGAERTNRIRAERYADRSADRSAERDADRVAGSETIASRPLLSSPLLSSPLPYRTKDRKRNVAFGSVSLAERSGEGTKSAIEAERNPDTGRLSA